MKRLFSLFLIVITLFFQGCASAPVSEPYKVREFARSDWHIWYPKLVLPVNVEVYLGSEVQQDTSLKRRDFEKVVLTAVKNQQGYVLDDNNYSLIIEFFHGERTSLSFLDNPMPEIRKRNYAGGIDVEASLAQCNIPTGCFCRYSYQYGAHLVLMLNNEVVGSTIIDGTANQVSVNPDAAFNAKCDWSKYVRNAQEAALEDLGKNLYWHLGFLHTLTGRSLQQ